MNLSIILDTIAPLRPELSDLWELIAEADADGELTEEEARDLGRAFADEKPLPLIWRGQRFLWPPAQREIFGGVARVVRQLVRIEAKHQAEQPGLLSRLRERLSA